MKLLKTIGVFALTILVLLSSSSFLVGVHFCKGSLKQVAILAKAEGCEKEKKLPPCHKHLASPCCEDETIVHEGEGFKASFSHVTISPSLPQDIALPEVILAEVIPSLPSSKPSYYNYDPPLRSYDLTVTHRVFLI